MRQVAATTDDRSSSRVNILLVDDRPANLLALEAVLEPLGQNLVTANSGVEALKRLLENDFAVILLDVQMPGLDGFETAALIKEREKSRHIPIIFVTAISTGQSQIFKGYTAGAVDYIAKPFEPEILKSKVTVFVELFRKSREVERQAALLQQKNDQMQADLQMAREIQSAFLPQQYPTLPPAVAAQDSAVRFYHRYFPTATLGGDFFDVRALSDKEIGVFICDVMGHGVRSALVTAVVRTLMDGLGPVARDPGRFLTTINFDLMTILSRMRTPLFASAFYLVANVATREMRYANAGHPSPFLIRPAYGTVAPLYLTPADAGPALGIIEDCAYVTRQMPLAAHDLIVLYTDGLYEVEGVEEAYDEERLLAAVRQHRHLPPGKLFDELLAEIQRFSAAGEFEDDVCLVGMEITGADGATE